MSVATTKHWRNRLKSLAAEAGVRGFHPHRLRDKFAVELVLPGVMMQDLSSLPGHGNVGTTKRFCAS